eukprot:351337-Chlamydomonas_euryale.AAC.2
MLQGCVSGGRSLDSIVCSIRLLLDSDPDSCDLIVHDRAGRSIDTTADYAPRVHSQAYLFHETRAPP